MPRAAQHRLAWQVAEAARTRYRQSEMLLVHRISLQARAGRHNEAQAMAVGASSNVPRSNRPARRRRTQGRVQRPVG